MVQSNIVKHLAFNQLWEGALHSKYTINKLLLLSSVVKDWQLLTQGDTLLINEQGVKLPPPPEKKIKEGVKVSTWKKENWELWALTCPTWTYQACTVCMCS